MRGYQYILLAAAMLAAATLAGRFIMPADGASSLRAADSDPTIAVCALPALLNEMMESERYRPDREQFEEEVNDKLQELRDRRDELMQDLEGLEPGDPEAIEPSRQLEMLGRQYQQMQYDGQNEGDALFARQMTEAWELICSSADAVAEDLGFDYVLITAGEDEVLNQTSSAIALRQMLARPVIVAPDDVDITDDVRDDLNM